MTSIYSLDWNSLDKKIPAHFNETAIPAIDKATIDIMGNVLKNKIYNYLIYYYNKGKLKGIMDSIFIHSQDEVKRVYFEITKNGVSVKLIKEVGDGNNDKRKCRRSDSESY